MGTAPSVSVKSSSVLPRDILLLIIGYHGTETIIDKPYVNTLHNLLIQYKINIPVNLSYTGLSRWTLGSTLRPYYSDIVGLSLIDCGATVSYIKEYLYNVVTLTVEGDGFDVGLFAYTPNLRNLTVPHNMEFRPNTFKYLRGLERFCTSFNTYSTEYCDLTDEMLMDIISLRELVLCHAPQVTDRGINHHMCLRILSLQLMDIDIVVLPFLEKLTLIESYSSGIATPRLDTLTYVGYFIALEVIQILSDPSLNLTLILNLYKAQKPDHINYYRNFVAVHRLICMSEHARSVIGLFPNLDHC